MKKVNEVSKISGVSIRTLHYYDSIGLLKPTFISSAGYRFYDDEALKRLQSIMFFRELEFSLKDIQSILDNPNHNTKDILQQQIKLLQLRQEHLTELINLAQNMIEEDRDIMNFKAFDTSKIEQYKEEVKQKWGNTQAYKEYEEKSAKGSDFSTANAGLLTKLQAIAALNALPPEHTDVQDKVRELQEFISSNFYNCTKEILAGLGQMYVCDERFKNNIENACGAGTAEFISSAIKGYCQ